MNLHKCTKGLPSLERLLKNVVEKTLANILTVEKAAAATTAAVAAAAPTAATAAASLFEVCQRLTEEWYCFVQALAQALITWAWVTA